MVSRRNSVGISNGRARFLWIGALVEFAARFGLESRGKGWTVTNVSVLVGVKTWRARDEKGRKRDDEVFSSLCDSCFFLVGRAPISFSQCVYFETHFCPLSKSDFDTERTNSAIV